MKEKEKDKYCIKFMYRILNEKSVFKKFSYVNFGNIEENKTVKLRDCIDYLEKRFNEIEENEVI